MQVVKIRAYSNEPANFHIQNAAPEYVFVHFLTPAIIKLPNETIRIQSNYVVV